MNLLVKFIIFGEIKLEMPQGAGKCRFGTHKVILRHKHHKP